MLLILLISKSDNRRCVFASVGIDPSSGDDDYLQHQTLNLDEEMVNQIVDTVQEGTQIMSLKNLYICFTQ